MSEQTQGDNKAADPNAANRLDPAFFTTVNEYLELTDRQSKTHGLKRISMASLYAAARFNSHVFLVAARNNAAEDRKMFLDYMTTLYRRMLNEHIDSLGRKRGIDVGESELAAEYAAAAAAASAATEPTAAPTSADAEE